MGDIYKARYKNALRIANVVNGLLSKGYLVLDEEGNKVLPFEVDEKGDIYQRTSDMCKAVHFINDKKLDNGYHTPIKEYNSYYSNWTYINPRAIRKFTW